MVVGRGIVVGRTYVVVGRGIVVGRTYVVVGRGAVVVVAGRVVVVVGRVVVVTGCVVVVGAVVVVGRVVVGAVPGTVVVGVALAALAQLLCRRSTAGRIGAGLLVPSVNNREPASDNGADVSYQATAFPPRSDMCVSALLQTVPVPCQYMTPKPWVWALSIAQVAAPKFSA